MKNATNIKEIKKFYSAKDEEFRVNHLLAEGWKLLSVTPGNDEGGYPVVVYVVGKEYESNAAPYETIEEWQTS